MKILSTSAFYKQAVRDSCFCYQPTGEDTDQVFYHYLERNYQDSLDKLNHAMDYYE